MEEGAPVEGWTLGAASSSASRCLEAATRQSLAGPAGAGRSSSIHRRKCTVIHGVSRFPLMRLVDSISVYGRHDRTINCSLRRRPGRPTSRTQSGLPDRVGLPEQLLAYTWLRYRGSSSRRVVGRGPGNKKGARSERQLRILDVGAVDRRSLAQHLAACRIRTRSPRISTRGCRRSLPRAIPFLDDSAQLNDCNAADKPGEALCRQTRLFLPFSTQPSIGWLVVFQFAS